MRQAKGKLDVLLIKPNVDIVNMVPPLGLGYLASALIRNGFQVDIKDCRRENAAIEDAVRLVSERQPKIVGISVCTNETGWAKECIRQLKRSAAVSIVIGGPHPTGLGKDIFDDMPDIDFAVYSEGEEAFPKLSDAILRNAISDETLRGIPNLIWKGASVTVNPLKLQDNLDELTFPAFHLMEPAWYPRRPHGGFSRAFPTAPIITTRGCPYPCRFCGARLMHGNRIRHRSVGNVIEEITLLTERYNVREIHIEDDNFTFKKEFVMSLCDRIVRMDKKILFSLPNGIRLDRIDHEMLSAMKYAGFYSMAVGIESGSQRTLDRMKKNLSVEFIREKVSLIKRTGFIVKGFFMLGYPGETPQDLELTARFAKSLELDRASFSVFIPLPGTPDYEDLIAQGAFDRRAISWENFYTGNLNNIPYSPSGMSKSEVQRFVTKALLAFYMRPRVLLKMFLSITSPEQVRFLFSRVKSLILRIK